jgi:hypothetical protein
MAIAAIVLRRDGDALQGYYWFTVAFAALYALLISATAALHVKEMAGTNWATKVLRHVPHFSTSLLLVLLLAVPVGAGFMDPVRAEVPAPLPERYIVEHGDSLWTIAERFTGDGATWTRFEQRRNPDLIFPGEIIHIPAP